MSPRVAARLARLEMENRALRAGLEATCRALEMAAVDCRPRSPALPALQAAAAQIRGYLATLDAARAAWEKQA